MKTLYLICTEVCAMASAILNWIKENSIWIFSGIGVSLLLFIIKSIMMFLIKVFGKKSANNLAVGEKGLSETRGLIEHIVQTINSTIPLGSIPIDDNEEQKRLANNNIELFSNYLNVNRFFIDSEILSYAEEIRAEINRYMDSLIIWFNRASEEWANSVRESINIYNDVFNVRIPELQRKMEERFRNIYRYSTQ